MRLGKAAITLIVGLAVLLGVATAWGGEEGGPPGGPQQPGGPERPGPGRRGPGMMLPFANIPGVQQELERHRQTLRTIMEEMREAVRQRDRETVERLANRLAEETATHHTNLAKILTDNREAVVRAILERIRQRVRQRRPGGPGEGPAREGPPRGPRGRGPRRGPAEGVPEPPANL